MGVVAPTGGGVIVITTVRIAVVTALCFPIVFKAHEEMILRFLCFLCATLAQSCIAIPMGFPQFLTAEGTVCFVRIVQTGIAVGMNYGFRYESLCSLMTAKLAVGITAIAIFHAGRRLCVGRNRHVTTCTAGCPVGRTDINAVNIYLTTRHIVKIESEPLQCSGFCGVGQWQGEGDKLSVLGNKIAVFSEILEGKPTIFLLCAIGKQALKEPDVPVKPSTQK